MAVPPQASGLSVREVYCTTTLANVSVSCKRQLSTPISSLPVPTNVAEFVGYGGSRQAGRHSLTGLNSLHKHVSLINRDSGVCGGNEYSLASSKSLLKKISPLGNGESFLYGGNGHSQPRPNTLLKKFSPRNRESVGYGGNGYSLIGSNLRKKVLASNFGSTPSRALAEHDIDTAYSSSIADRLTDLAVEFQAISDARERFQKLRAYAARLTLFPSTFRILANRVMGCTAQVWLTGELRRDGRMYFAADSDSELTRGFCAILIEAVNGAWPEEVLAFSSNDLSCLGLSLPGVSVSRSNSWYNILVSMQKKTRVAVAELEGRPSVEPFPSLLITADTMKAQGSFARAQAKYLLPDEAKVQELGQILQQKQIGVVAHFYMDPEVQGVLAAAQKSWPHIHISDSLVMADRAVSMADAGCKHIAVLGVDFMSENVRAIVDQAGYEQVNVYRMSREKIGCSLAAAAETETYTQFLESAAQNKPALHVIYINTSLETKAHAHAIVPTITCTSSNVVQTVLQAFAQVSDLTVWYGPDTYMGANLTKMFHQMAELTDEEIKGIHPSHNKQSINALLPRLHYFQDGTCIVHDLFGHEVVSRVRQGYCDAFLTAHFEVPGEMFALATEAKQRGMGVVGSTQNILDFIKFHVQEAVDRGFDDRLQFVLGTETGMVTAIVGSVRNILSSAKMKENKVNIEVEIVFPVSPDAISTSSVEASNKCKNSELAVIPGVSSGEGCSSTGGCASCPYMKMNSLDSLLNVCTKVGTSLESVLVPQLAHRFDTQHVAGCSVADLGCKPILHMRYFQSKGSLPQELVSGC